MASKRKGINPINEVEDIQDGITNEPSGNSKSENNKKDAKKGEFDDLIQKANQKLNKYINNFSITRPNQTVVYLNVTILRVGEIDNLNENFKADASIEAYWEDDSIKDGENFDPHYHWEPELYIDNAVGKLKEENSYKILRKDGKTTVCESKIVSGTFWEKLELNDFPLDSQDLTITVTSHKSYEEVLLEKSKMDELSINTNDFQQQQEWILFPKIYLQTKHVYDIWRQHHRPCFSVSAKITRRPGYYIYNTYMLIFFLSALGFVPFSFQYLAPHFRMQTTVFLMLALANFRLVLTQKLPAVSYLNFLDKYSFAVLILLVLLNCWHGIIGSSTDIFYNLEKEYTNPYIRSDMDRIALYISGIIYIVYHIIYIFMFLIKYWRSMKTDNEPDEDRKKKVKSLSVRDVNLDATNYRPLNNTVSPLGSETNMKRVNEFKIK